MLLDTDSDLTDVINCHVAQAVSQAVSDEAADVKCPPKWGGSKKGKSPNLERDFGGACKTMVSHYFSGNSSLHDEIQFERRFRMKRVIFNRMWDAI